MNQLDWSGVFMRGHSELEREGGKRFSKEIPNKRNLTFLILLSSRFPYSLIILDDILICHCFRGIRISY